MEQTNSDYHYEVTAGLIAAPKRVEKTWGYELIYINTEKYCMKLLHFKEEGKGTSAHFHINKHETLLVTEGRLGVYLFNKDKPSFIILEVGEALVVTPGLVHELVSYSPTCSIIEASSFSEDSDSYRLNLNC